jgi:uncharacterized protein RhaS with RHS repeats
MTKSPPLACGGDFFMSSRHGALTKVGNGIYLVYEYDELSNRTSVTKGGVPTMYSYNGEKNRLTAVGGASYQYDAVGNLTGDGVSTYT